MKLKLDEAFPEKWKVIYFVTKILLGRSLPLPCTTEYKNSEKYLQWSVTLNDLDNIYTLTHQNTKTL